MYSAILCGCICTKKQADNAVHLFKQALDNHYGSPKATLDAFKEAKFGDFEQVAWDRAVYAAGCAALIGITHSGGARFEESPE